MSSGYPDCSDGSDESACPTFQCDSGSVVPLEYHCDGISDCFDGSDEVDGCPTFRCADGTLVPAQAECNGDTECADGSDENGCPVEADLICE